MKYYRTLLQMILFILIFNTTSAQSISPALENTTDNKVLKFKNYATKLHVTFDFNYGEFSYTDPIFHALVESDFSKQVITYPEVDMGNFVLDLFTFGLFGLSQSAGPTISYENPTFSTTSGVFKIDMSYNLKPKMQFGSCFSLYSSSSDVVRNSNHGSTLNVDASVTNVAAYVAYDFTQYERIKKFGLGLKIGGGLNGSFFNEKQVYMAYENNLFIDTKNKSNNFQLGLLLNTKAEFIIGKHFSIVLADLTFNQPLSESKVAQSYDPNGKVILQSHKVNTSYFSYGFGIGLHF